MHKKYWNEEMDNLLLSERESGRSYEEILKHPFFRGYTNLNLRKRNYILQHYTNKQEETKARILIYDIEVSPLTTYTWGIGKQRLNIGNIVRDYFILSWAAKWLDAPEIYSDCITQTEVKNGNDKRIVKTLYNLLNEADIVIAYNGVRFDEKKVNTRVLLNGLPPIKPHKVIDPYQLMRRRFAFTSNKLDYIQQQLGGERKLETGMDLWVACMDGDEAALESMEVYNRQDVLVLEDLYKKILGWIDNHPNITVFDVYNEDIERCPNCGKQATENGKVTSGKKTYKSMCCISCGRHFQGKRL